MFYDNLKLLYIQHNHNADHVWKSYETNIQINKQ